MELTPKQVVRELDRYIIGQDEAKRAVALKMVLSPIVTWPSPATAILPSFLTAQMVVPLSVIYVYLRYDTLGYVGALP